MTSSTPSQLGAANRRRGIQAERDLARWLRGNGFPHAERAVRTGFRAADRTSADPGDIAGTPGIVWSVKDCAAEQITKWLVELDGMQGDAGTSGFALLVVKRRGSADPGRWWCWLDLVDVLLLAMPPGTSVPNTPLHPIRSEVGRIVPLLHAAGYGDPAAPRDMTTPTLANPGRTAR